MRKTLLLSACLLLARNAAAEPTLAELLSAPFASQLIASPRGDRVVWTVSAAGRRNIYVADGVRLEARALTHNNDDDGRGISGLSLSSDGAWLAFVRGHEESHEDSAVNPTSDPRGTKQEIFVIATAPNASSAAPVAIAEGVSPALSPDGKRLAFVKGGQVQLASGDHFKTVSAVMVRGRAGSPRWSPDGRALAFTVVRRDHAFIAVYRPAENRIVWMQPEIGMDLEPVWSPDGKQLAFLRLPGKKSMEATDPPKDWSENTRLTVVVADAESGQGRVVYASRALDSSLFSYEIDHPILFAGGRVLFVSERDGWQRLYSVAAAGGGEPIALSPTGCEVEDLTLAADGKSALAVNNCADGERRQIARVGLSDGTWTQLTAPRSVNWSPAALADGRIAFLSSTALQPGTPAVLTDGAAPRFLVSPWSAPGLIEPSVVSFRAADGSTVHADLFLPPTPAKSERHAALVFSHGGPIRQMLPAWHYMGFYHFTYAANQYLAMHGFVVLAVNYRMGIGYGRAFRLPPRRGPLGASEYADLVAAARFLRARADVDPRRLGTWGGSYGGLMTAQALARNSDLFAAGVDYAGLHDWVQYLDDPNTPARARQLALASSPVAHLAGWRSPVLFIHGDDDNNVAFGQTIDLAERLREKGGVEVETLTLPDEAHYLLRHQSWLTAMRATAEFFTRRLQRASAPVENQASGAP